MIFLHDFLAARENYPNLKVGPYLARKVKEALDTRGVETRSINAILAYLMKYKKRQENYRKEYSIERLRKNLQWPDEVPDVRDQIHLFFDQVNAQPKNLSEKDKKTNPKLIAKLVMKRLPKAFKTGPHKLSGLPKLKDLSKLKERLLQR